jgi:acyl-CoA synthetase (AMP-forming)/AMP-acid ligase II
MRVPLNVWDHLERAAFVHGDRVVVDEPGAPASLGRTGGENVSSIEVEDCLFQHPAVAEVAVIGVPDEKWGETIKALVVLKPGAAAGERGLIDFCRSRLAHFKCPTSVEIRPELARSATGKLQKFRLREPYWQGRERRVN